jgi:hypothetical protein
MRAINHAMTGAIIGLSVAAPVAIPLALASHFALDALPHEGNLGLSHKGNTALLSVDIALCFVLVIIIFAISPQYWWLAILCAFLATSPDFMWISVHKNHAKGKTPKPISERHVVVRLHHKVQWFQQPVGLIVEVAWAIITGLCLYFLLRS